MGIVIPRVRQIFLGYDPRDYKGYAVARYTFQKYDRYVPVHGLVLDDLRRRGLYSRPTEVRVNSEGHNQLWDTISDAPMSTEFSISRFLVPHLAREGWAAFLDGDVMAIDNPVRIFDHADSRYAVMCVQHEHNPEERVKMDGQIQTKYSRKNWSSVMLFNCEHPANRRLTLDMINTAPGRALHAFCWLEDEEIGPLPQEFNYLVGYTHLNSGRKPTIVHFTSGLPDVPGYEHQEYADTWRSLLPYAVGAL